MDFGTVSRFLLTYVAFSITANYGQNSAVRMLKLLLLLFS